MSESSPQAQAIHEEVRLAPYDPRWPSLFSQEQGRLLALLPQVLALEHIGSTAVVGMGAKPVIDIMAGVRSMAVADSLCEPILASGYTTSHEFNATLTDRRWFMRSANGRRTHHLHVVVHLSQTWVERLAFRDLLRQSDSLAHAYSQLKSELSVRFRRNREAYTDAKANFIAAAIAVA